VAFLFLVAGLVMGIVISPFLFALLLILYGYLRLFLFGIHIQATVLRVEPYLPKKKRLFAQWQDPKTGRTYQFSTPIKRSHHYQRGSFVSVVFDPKKPNWRLIAFSEELPWSLIRVLAALPY
jgi:hypothetical protein